MLQVSSGLRHMLSILLPCLAADLGPSSCPLSSCAAVEALISINNHLRQPDAAVGILNIAQKELHMELKESWCAQLSVPACCQPRSYWSGS